MNQARQIDFESAQLRYEAPRAPTGVRYRNTPGEARFGASASGTVVLGGTEGPAGRSRRYDTHGHDGRHDADQRDDERRPGVGRTATTTMAVTSSTTVAAPTDSSA